MDSSDKPIIVVTGASGYLGVAVVKRLHVTYRVVGLDRSSPPHPPHGKLSAEHYGSWDRYIV
ncbi:NAD-dependent epimerase/dehydratase family protein [Gymnodinialimonas ceratoperidinii]|uniref:NAD-dependent epimerase/dehydratase family protein n=1 Tax=Gymnodinialimonas ceratoperidinii TaxID=2856823 RepID=UPI0031FEEAFD